MIYSACIMRDDGLQIIFMPAPAGKVVVETKYPDDRATRRSEPMDIFKAMRYATTILSMETDPEG